MMAVVVGTSDVLGTYNKYVERTVVGGAVV